LTAILPNEINSLEVYQYTNRETICTPKNLGEINLICEVKNLKPNVYPFYLLSNLGEIKFEGSELNFEIKAEITKLEMINNVNFFTFII